MTCHKDIQQIRAPARATYAWLAAVTDVDGVAAHRDGVESIRVDVWELKGDRKGAVGSDGRSIAGNAAWDEPAVASVMYTAYQHGPAWHEDSVGYNSRYLIAFPLPDRTYYATMTYDLTNGQTVVLPVLVTTY